MLIAEDSGKYLAFHLDGFDADLRQGSGDGRGQVIYPDFLVSGRNDFVLDPAVAAAPSYHAELYNAQQGRPPSQLTEAIYSRNPQDPNGFGERGSAQIDHNGHPQGLDPRYLDRLRLEASRCQELGVKCRDLEQGNQDLKAQMHDLKQDHKKKFETLERWMNDQVTEIRGYLATIVGKVEHGDALLQTTKNEVQGMLKETIQRWEAQAAEESAATKGT
ncbi:hypothetical protein LEL_10571 [Akanthomyces lecanii RCEF 1005]|uniref:Uncharacterized protein n=1 Tax=Akanthomyces lecanii RCEF 1005 TaxID=1081108 RepID=A0A167XLJ0_CORDF|nr:hypothetical protein LEL_10571 [Akanthomyces lecanii RCEF 1005]